MSLLQDFVTQNKVKCYLVDRLPARMRAIADSCRKAEELEVNRSSTLTAIERHQEERLRLLLARAAELPRYGTLAARLGKPLGAVTLADLPRIPFLSKDVLRDEGPQLRLSGAEGVYENYSGGSTGIPIRFWQDERYRIDLSAATRRANRLAGMFPGARVAKLWGAPQDRRKIEGLSGRLRLWLLNQRYYDTFDMGPARMEAYHRDLAAFQPDFIQAYASSALLLARFLKSRRLRPTYPRQAIVSSAERLTPQMRAEIEEVFPVRVFDRYGSREVSAIAAECSEHQGLHIQMASYIVETIDPATLAPVTGRPGEIVITVLNNYAMPFLRYRIGDMGILDTTRCSCGRPTYRLREVLGRTSDNFLMADGRIVHGEYFTHIFYGREGIEQFQFVQHTPEEYTLQIVPTPYYRQAVADQIESEVRDMIGPAARLQFELREAIPKTASGKYRFTVSHVDLGAAVGGGRP